ncbi:MAG: hypothetical protein KDK64_08165 [Chlamydiia bacterium]|nr:hypothetical protein [Chlamydiia bacterium]
MEVRHFDAIHHTNLIYGITVVAVKPAEGELGGWEVIRPEEEAHYHVRTICHQLAVDFLAHRDQRDYMPLGFDGERVSAIQTDNEFRTHAVIEFEALNREREEGERIGEQEPPVFHVPEHESVEAREKRELEQTLTDRLVEAFQETTLGSKDGNGRLEVDRMRAIRDDVLRKHRERQAPVMPRGEHLRGGGQPQIGEGEADISCEPKWVAVGTVFGLGLMLFNLLREATTPDHREQKVTHVKKGSLGTEMHRPTTIY